VFTPGGLQPITVSLTMPATVTLTLAGRSLTRALPAGISRLVLPAPATARPHRVTLVAATGTRRAIDAVRVFPPRWLPVETAALVADAITANVDHCRQFGPVRVDCLTNKTDACHAVSVRLWGDRLLWAEYRGCAIRSRPRLLHAPRTLAHAPLQCDDSCPTRLFGRIDEAAIVPAT
jgi:hypothetical protein